MKFVADWGDDIVVAITLNKADETALLNGKSFQVEGDGYGYDGDSFIDTWQFTGGLDGELVVSYCPVDGDDFLDTGDGFIGSPRDCLVEESQQA